MKSQLTRKQFLITAFCCASVFISNAQTRYDDILQDYFNADGNGAAAIVTKGDDVIYKATIGKANLELHVPMSPEHIFRIGSITKQFSRRAGGQVFPVNAYDTDKFYYESRTTVAFERDKDGRVVGQIVTSRSGTEVHATKTDEEVFIPEVVKY
jgi:beta-lactamase family protein